MYFIPFRVGNRVRSFRSLNNRYESYRRKLFGSKSLRSLYFYFYLFWLAWSLQYGSYGGGIREEICEFVRAGQCGCRQVAERLIGRHYLARYRDGGVSRPDRDYIRTWPWKIVCHKFAGRIPRLWSAHVTCE